MLSIIQLRESSKVRVASGAQTSGRATNDGVLVHSQSVLSIARLARTIEPHARAIELEDCSFAGKFGGMKANPGVVVRKIRANRGIVPRRRVRD